ncbi:MAG: hypothetical protein R3D55_16100 [Chloroflexota bacterium]
MQRPVHTALFGGGTPSLMSPSSLGRILDGVRAHFNLAADAEVTMEANPGTVDLAYLTAVSQTGINRSASAYRAWFRLNWRCWSGSTILPRWWKRCRWPGRWG